MSKEKKRSLAKLRLKVIDDDSSWDQRIHEIIVDKETDSAWLGRPVHNLSCPVLEWPKFAWKEVA